jgi:transcriptional regulator
MQTIRRQIISLLMERALGAREISQTLGIREKEVYGHLPHIARSLTSQGKKLVVQHSSCLVCGYRFDDRQRLTRPGRCPRCKEGHLEAPKFHIA